MSLWQLTAQVEGYIDANTPPDKKRLSRAEIDAISERL
jgi:hypothetical protein